jgi:RNA recognition motif-containing protein
MKIHISNLLDNVKDEDVKQLFTSYGEVKSVTIVTFRETGGAFAFVEMTDEKAAETAISELNNNILDGRTIRVCQTGQEGQKGSGIYPDGREQTKNRQPYSGF